MGANFHREMKFRVEQGRSQVQLGNEEGGDRFLSPSATRATSSPGLPENFQPMPLLCGFDFDLVPDGDDGGGGGVAKGLPFGDDFGRQLRK